MIKLRPMSATQRSSIVLYIAKTVTGVVLLMTGAKMLGVNDVSWVIISMLLVLSPDSKEVLPLTIVRIKANLVASVASVVFLLLANALMPANTPTIMIAICLAIIVTIILCHYFDLMAGSRPALAAVVIILLHSQGVHFWSTPVERVSAVILGCIIGLLLTVIFHREVPIRMGANKASKKMDASE